MVSTTARLELVSLPGSRLDIGDGTTINFGTAIFCASRITIGNNCMIGAHVQIMDSDLHRIEDKTWDLTGEAVVLEDRSWIGNRAILLKGVTVGHDSVVAMGSVVTRNVPPRTVVFGAPARVVRRF
jgi:acetyltransferase-like isoleucine patch superfamily enzyme